MSGWRAGVAWTLWLALLAGWTYALLSPAAPSAAGWFLPLSLKFYVAKAVHLTAYGVLALGAMWLPGRWWALGVLVAHAGVTEWLQTMVPGRSGHIMDVVINGVGIGLGLLAARWWARGQGEARL